MGRPVKTYAIDLETQAMIRDLAVKQGVYQAQIIETGVRLLEEQLKLKEDRKNAS
jgi:hypothetical protein